MTRLSSAARGVVAVLVVLAALLTVPPASAAARAHTDPEVPTDFVALRTVDPTILEEMRYITQHNFVGEPIDGYQQPICILTRPAAEALHKAQAKLLPQGYTLKVYDCYRPQRAVNHFVRWAENLNDQSMKGSSTRTSTSPVSSMTVTSPRSPATAAVRPWTSPW